MVHQETFGGHWHCARYRIPDNNQTCKRGFRTKRDAELFLAYVEIAENSGRYVYPTQARATICE